MEGEEGVGSRLKKLSSGSGEVDYKTKSGNAWSHSYLNQKPWHPLSYPNQRRKWIAEQIHSQRQRRSEEVAREYGQEQEFFRQTALISKKDKEKMETMQAVSFMYVRPPGYNAESAKAAELEDERKKEEQPATAAMQPEAKPVDEEKKKPRPKDVFGRPLPTEEEFEILKNAPRLETGAPARVKPFGVEVRNVKCLRCGNYGHQSGDRECPLKDVIMPNEESRLKRDDPLTAIMAHVDPCEPLKWELKRQPGNFSPRGGFKPDDPNQQIVAEDIFDEYGGFLAGSNVPDLLTSLSSKPRRMSKKKSKHKRQSSLSDREIRVSDKDGSSLHSGNGDRRSRNEKKHKKKKKRNCSKSSASNNSEWVRHPRKNRHKHYCSSEDSDSDRNHRSRKKHPYSSEDDTRGNRMIKQCRDKHSYQPEGLESDRDYKSKKTRQKHSLSSEEAERLYVSEKRRNKRSLSSEDSDCGRHQRKEKSGQKHSYTYTDESGRNRRCKKSRY